MHPRGIASVDTRNEPRRPPAVGFVLLAELCAQKGLFGPNAREDRRDDQRRQDYPGSRTKGQGSSEHQDKHPEIARMTNDPINAVSDQLVPGLDGHQPAKSATKDKDWPDPQHREQYDSDVSDTQWTIIRKFLPQRGGLGQPPRYERREVFNAIKYVTKTGCLGDTCHMTFLGGAWSIITLPVGRGWEFLAAPQRCPSGKGA
jgi:Putative transposase of IS4/5 family (DUF4096)